jgi:ABC-type multidrug transport system fused ATPase/permease subunit
MSRFQILRNIICRHRSRLILTYFLFGLEMLGSLLRPFFLGEAVNDLFKNNYEGLIILSIVHFSWLIIGIIRHRFDTRTYSAIYTSFVANFLSRRIKATDVSKLSAHSTLAREFVDFLEYDLIYVLEAAFNIFGSLILLYFYQSDIVIVCIVILLPVSLISHLYGRKMRKLNQHKNDELEKQVDVIATGNINHIRNHYNNLRNWQIKISDKEAWSFGMMELMVMGVIVLSLLIITRSPGTAIEAGSLIGLYNYLLKFLSGLDAIPYTVQRLSSLNDITRRIELQTEDIPMEEKTEPLFAKKVSVVNSNRDVTIIRSKVQNRDVEASNALVHSLDTVESVN